MKTKRLTSLFLSIIMVLSLMIPSAFAAEGGLKASYHQSEVTVNATGLELSKTYSLISVRKGSDVFGLGGGKTDANGTLTAIIPVGSLTAGTYQVHVFKDADGTVALSGEFTVAGETPGPGPGPGPVEPEKIPDGNYYVNIALWNEVKDEPSMGDKAFENNRRALVTVSSGRVTKVQVATNPVDMTSVVSAIIEAQVAGRGVTPIEKAPITTEPAGNHYQYLQSFSFTMPSGGQPAGLSGVTYVPVRFKVPDTPMDAVAENGFMDARLRFSWGAAVKTNDTTINGSGEMGHGINPETGEKIKDINLVDSKTGIRLDTSTEAIAENVKLNVAEVTSGKAMDAAKKALSSVKDSWKLFDINTTVDGKITAPEGQVKLSIPCTDKGLTIYRINDNGTKVPIKGKIEKGYYVFNTSKLGLFAVVGEMSETKGFIDVADHWAENDINFIVERGLFNGVSEDKFAPNMTMTRGMFVTVLARLNGADLAKVADSDFTDVAKDTWYSKSVAWAAANGVVNGVGNNKFDPDGIITRQDMAVILARYAEKFNINLKDEKNVTFADEAAVADYAKTAVDAMASAGLLNGVGNNKFAPVDDSSRAEVATLLARFIRNYSL